VTISNDEIAYIVQEVVRRVGAGGSPAPDPGVCVPCSVAAAAADRDAPSAARGASMAGGGPGTFPDVDSAVAAAAAAQRRLVALGIEKRKELIEAMRRAALGAAADIGRMAVEETGLGRVPDKIAKVELAARKTPGVEDLETGAYSGDRGLTLVELAPFGVIGSITPSTNPGETVINNGIAMIAAGNAVVFNCHPSAKKVSRYTVELLNRAIAAAGGPSELLCVVAEPTMESSKALMAHPGIRLLAVTGGPEIVRVAMNSGKKVIAAGPGNPPVVVDETADIETAARSVVDGASFDNNVLCIAEKEVFCVSSVFDRLMDAMERAGAYRLSLEQAKALVAQVLVRSPSGEYAANKKFVGKDVQVLLRAIGIEAPPAARLAFFEAPADCPLVVTEQLMPVMPVVRCSDVDEAIRLGVAAEGGCHHTAMMHSKNVDNLTKMGRLVDTTIFVKNGPSFSGLGFGGEGFTSYTIATPTGEGVTSPVSYTRKRRCVLNDAFRIV